MATYNITDMRLVFPKGKVAENNPDRWATVYGEFHDETGDPLSFTSKEITLDMAKSPEFIVNVDEGILVLPSGKRGRTAYESETQDDIAAALAALRK